MPPWNTDLLQESWEEYYIPSVGPGYVTVRRGGPFDNSAPQARLQIPNEQQTLERVKEVVANADMEAAFDSGGSGGSSGGGSSGDGGSSGGGSSEPSGSPDVRIVDFGLSSGFPDQTPPLAAGDRVTFEITLTNQGTQDKFQQGFVVEADGQQVFDGALMSPTSSQTKRNLRVDIPSVPQQTEVNFCARLDNGRDQCVSIPVVPNFDPDAVDVESITVPDQITLGDGLSGTFRVRNPNPIPADIRWRVDFEGPVVDDGVARVPGETVVEIDYSGRGPEQVALFDVCARLDSVTPS